jgi:hypothetical protein
LTVEFISNGGHAAWEFLQVHFEKAFLVSSIRPAVIQHNIIVSDIPQTRVDELF